MHDYLFGFASRARSFLLDESGPTSVEYAVLLALIALVAAATIQSIGSRVLNVYSAINDAIP